MTPQAPGTVISFRRRRARARERGAVVFIVAMTLALLASLGLYALLTASSEVKTAGNARQNVQSHYLAEAGVVAASLQLTQFGDGAILPMMRTKTDYNSSQPRNQCWSLKDVPASATSTDMRSQQCKIMNYRPPRFDLNASGGTLGGFVSTPAYNTGALFPDSTGTQGSPALFPTQLDPEIRVEITDPMASASLGGNATDGQMQQVVRPCTVTVTTYGETLPQTGVFNGAGLEVGRARVTFLTYGDNCQ